VRRIYKDFKEKNPDSKLGKSSFIKIKKNMGCHRAKGVVDGCCICLPEKQFSTPEEKFVMDQHKILFRKTCRAIRAIREFLPRGYFFFF
jgi:hypothetical protein